MLKFDINSVCIKFLQACKEAVKSIWTMSLKNYDLEIRGIHKKLKNLNVTEFTKNALTL